MGGMRYTTTLAVIARALHAHVYRCMQTEDVACQKTTFKEPCKNGSAHQRRK